MIPLIIGFDVNGWNVFRALKKEGLSPVIVDDRPDSIFWKCRSARLVYASRLSGPDIVATLNSLASANHQYILTSALENTIATLNDARNELHSNIQLVFPPRETLAMLLDKKLFYLAAKKIGCRIQPMYFVEGSEWRVFGGEELIHFPCILKTRRKLYVNGMAKAYRIDNSHKLHATLKAISRLPGLNAEDILLQEWVPGSDGDVIFCMQFYNTSGAAAMSFVGRKIRQWPPETGGTASAVPIQDEEAIAESTRFFQSVQMKGLCSMEFKRSSTDGQLYLIEPTVCRADYQEGVAICNGYNFPYALYCSTVLGRTYHPRPPSRQLKWLHVGSDYQAARHYMKRGSLTLRQLLKSWSGPRCYAVWDWKHPEPFIELVRRKFANRFRRIWNHNWKPKA